MLSTSENIGCMTYEECSYIYDNITQDPGQLIELFSKDYNTILFIYNNITKDLNEILDIYCYIRGEKIEDIKVIYKEINDYEKFKRILKAFEEDEIT